MIENGELVGECSDATIVFIGTECSVMCDNGYQVTAVGSFSQNSTCRAGDDFLVTESCEGRFLKYILNKLFILEFI